MTQWALPTSDVLNEWSSGGWAEIDEASPGSDSDFAYTIDNPVPTPGNSGYLEVHLSDETDPEVDTGHIVRFRSALIDGGVLASSAGTGCDLDVILWQGATNRATAFLNLDLTGETAWTPHSYALSGGEADSITDYTDLRLSFDADGGGGSPANRRGAGISWAALELPDAPSTDRAAQVSAYELETPNAARQAMVSAYELETTDAARQAQVSAYELETTDPAAQAQVSAYELEVPNLLTRAQISAYEFEVPVATDRRAQVSAVELETPNAARQAMVAAFELETTDAARRAMAAAFELEVPGTETRAQISAFELETPSLGGAGYGLTFPVAYSCTGSCAWPCTDRNMHQKRPI